MSEGLKFHVIPKLSVRPDKFVFYNHFVRKEQQSLIIAVAPPLKKIERSAQLDLDLGQKIERVGFNPFVFNTSPTEAVKKLTKTNKHNFEISPKAAARIQEKVTWLYTLAKMKTVPAANGTKDFTFKINFITLTLPSVQKHETAFLTKNCLNQFLTEVKTKFGMNNLLWRLEFQKNGNAHYHIVTDTYLPWFQMQNIWNRILNKHGYIEPWSAKMRKLTFEEYRFKYSNQEGCENFGRKGFAPKSELLLKTNFSYGTATRWTQPHSVDIKTCSSGKRIAFYISKYITKPSEHSMNKIVSEREPTTTNLRLWFCSRSLSRLDKIEIFTENLSSLQVAVFSALEKIKKYIFDYCEVWYFDYTKQISTTRALLWKLYNNYAISRHYIPARA